jgi:hypothetical protein
MFSRVVGDLLFNPASYLSKIRVHSCPFVVKKIRNIPAPTPLVS